MNDESNILPPVMESGNGKSESTILYINDLHIKTSVYKGSSHAMFDYQRVSVLKKDRHSLVN